MSLSSMRTSSTTTTIPSSASPRPRKMSSSSTGTMSGRGSSSSPSSTTTSPISIKPKGWEAATRIHPSATNFNWSAYMRNNNYAYGVGTAIPSSRISLPSNSSTTSRRTRVTRTLRLRTSPRPHDGRHQQRQHRHRALGRLHEASISATVNSANAKNIGLVFGFNYSQFKLDDGQLNGYQYVPSSSVYLTGSLHRPELQGKPLLREALLQVLESDSSGRGETARGRAERPAPLLVVDAKVGRSHGGNTPYAVRELRTLTVHYSGAFKARRSPIDRYRGGTSLQATTSRRGHSLNVALLPFKNRSYRTHMTYS